MIRIIGAGAMGTALARAAQHHGTEVKLFARADAVPSAIEGEQIWVACKRGQVDSLIAKWGALLNSNPDTPLFLIQNGLGLSEQLKLAGLRRPWTRVACWWGAKWQGRTLELTPAPRRMTFAGSNHAHYWQQCGFETETLSALDESLLEWRKALTNLTLNPVVTLKQAPNGALLLNSDWIAQARVLHLEARSVAHALKVALPPEAQTWNDVLLTAQNTPQNRNSLLQDLEAGRDWELPWLNAWLVNRAHELGLDLPQNRAVVAALEALRGNLK